MSIQVEVVFKQTLLNITVPEESKIIDTILLSKIIEKHPEVDLSSNKVGIFGKILPLDYTVSAGDRVEIYQPRLKDPKELRREKSR